MVELEDGIPVRGRKKGKVSVKTTKLVKEKFKEEREGMIKPITAKNNNQKKYLDSLQKNVISVAKGSAGSGKTYLAAKVASNDYLRGLVDKIVVTRPFVQMGRNTGFWPGGIEEKLTPYLLPILTTIKDTIGAGKYETDFGKSILIQPMESVRGMSFREKTFLIVDEAQNCSPEEIRSLVTRLEDGARIAFCGDDKQMDLKGLSGITYLSDMIKNHNLEKCGVVEFQPEDCVRSGLTRQFVQIFEAEGPAPK